MFKDAQPSDWDRDGDGVPDAIDAEVTPPADDTAERQFELQQEVAKQQQLYEAMSNAMKKADDAAKGVADNVRG